MATRATKRKASSVAFGWVATKGRWPTRPLPASNAIIDPISNPPRSRSTEGEAFRFCLCNNIFCEIVVHLTLQSLFIQRSSEIQLIHCTLWLSIGVRGAMFGSIADQYLDFADARIQGEVCHSLCNPGSREILTLNLGRRQIRTDSASTRIYKIRTDGGLISGICR